MLTEFYSRTAEPNGDSWLIVTTIVEDPKYLTQPFITSTHFRRQPDARRLEPSALHIAMSSSIAGFMEWLANTPMSVSIRESLWGYPIIETIHVLGLCLFLGFTMMLDLRLLGVAMKTNAGFGGLRTAGALDGGRVCRNDRQAGRSCSMAIPAKFYGSIFMRDQVRAC